LAFDTLWRFLVESLVGTCLGIDHS
jgi:hypothetical protein